MEADHAGLVVSLGSIVLLYAWFRFKLWDLQNLKYAKTPRTRLSLLALASGAWLALLPAIQLGINDDFAQDDLTPQVDTGNGTFLIFGPPFFLLTLIVILAFGRFFVLPWPSLPANLWCWDSSQPKRSWILTAIYTLLGVTIVLLFVWSIGNLPWVLPSLMIGFYVILSSRAAVINRV